ncbi:MAG TPA: IS481 family transposase [Acetobacteraceae bacterium]|nr:IS481 family transposase [Acetobacteraceae bacterium]
MPWREVSRMEGREEFVSLAMADGANVALLCRRFGISRKTGYKWLARHRTGAELIDRSRRPLASPLRTSPEMEAAVVALRQQRPSWGGRKLRRRLLDQGYQAVPAASTIGAILGRHDQIDAAEAVKHTPFRRFEHDRPNALWQMDFKGHFAHAAGRCHPLTVLDDHSRYAVCLTACADETAGTVRERLIAVFRRYGLPERINVDNGSPWGDGAGGRYTMMTVWLLRLGLRCSHSRPYHPQTNGKDERFHRTLKRDVLYGRSYGDLTACQRAFDDFRIIYNGERPHEALGFAVPASRYCASTREYPETLPPIEYDPADQVRQVQQGGRVSFQGRELHLPKAFAGQPIALRPTTTDGIWTAVFVAQRIAQIDLRDALHPVQPVTHVPEHV